MLVIKTIEGLTCVSPISEPCNVWVFDEPGEARQFITAWWSDDVAQVSVDPYSGRTVYDYVGEL